jgi:hypothetical protein
MAFQSDAKKKRTDVLERDPDAVAPVRVAAA